MRFNGKCYCFFLCKCMVITSLYISMSIIYGTNLGFIPIYIKFIGFFYANRPSWRFIKSSIHPSFFSPMNTVTPPLHYYKEKAEQIKLILDIMIWFTEYEVTSSVISPNGHAVSVVTTNQTHTAVENLKPESRYAHWTLDCVCLSPTHRIFHYTTDSSFFSCFFFFKLWVHSDT